MKIKELRDYCKSIEIDCDICEHKDDCKKMVDYLENQSPVGVIKLVEENLDLDYPVSTS